jgi:hypothetical protein
MKRSSRKLYLALQQAYVEEEEGLHYATADTCNTRKLRVAQLRLSLLRLNPKKSLCM